MTEKENIKEKFNYSTRPLLEEIPVRKQAAKRHYGVHGYFTKQSWNVVAEYIKNFSQIGDIILDPYGGSGVTAIEAMMNNRKAINIDINPMAIFMVKALTAPVELDELKKAFQEVKRQYIKHEPEVKEDIDKILLKYKNLLPKPLLLPKTSPKARTLIDLFSKKYVILKLYLKLILE